MSMSGPREAATTPFPPERGRPTKPTKIRMLRSSNPCVRVGHEYEVTGWDGECPRIRCDDKAHEFDYFCASDGWEPAPSPSQPSDGFDEAEVERVAQEIWSQGPSERKEWSTTSELGREQARAVARWHLRSAHSREAGLRGTLLEEMRLHSRTVRERDDLKRDLAASRLTASLMEQARDAALAAQAQAELAASDLRALLKAARAVLPLGSSRALAEEIDAYLSTRAESGAGGGGGSESPKEPPVSTVPFEPPIMAPTEPYSRHALNGFAHPSNKSGGSLRRWLAKEEAS